MFPMHLIFVGVFGLLIGSFLNVVVYRLPQGESIILPRSQCPNCRRLLRAWELIPLVSFCLLKGRCHSCGVRISRRYPGVELLTGVVFVLTAAAGLSLETHPARICLNLVFAALLIVLAFIDLDTFYLPDVLTLPLLGIGLLGAFLVPGAPSGGESLCSALGAGCLFGSIALIYPQGMGWGDVKLAAALGAFLGFPSIFLAVFMSSVLGVLAGGFLLWTGPKSFRRQIPFGPYLALGAIFTLWWGLRFWEWYWG